MNDPLGIDYEQAALYVTSVADYHSACALEALKVMTRNSTQQRGEASQWYAKARASAREALAKAKLAQGHASRSGSQLATSEATETMKRAEKIGRKTGVLVS